jgi:hypothetical protein
MARPVVVLVEGDSDRVAIETLAARRGLSLDGVSVLAMGGATNIGHYLARYAGQDVRLAGLCDVGEEGYFRRALERVGLGTDLTRADMEALGFGVCVADLEDELIRAVGIDAVEVILTAEGELRSYRSLQRQPAQRGRTVEQQLHRFIGTRAGRKIRYARLLVEALDLARVPPALDRLVAGLDPPGPTGSDRGTDHRRGAGL